MSWCIKQFAQVTALIFLVTSPHWTSMAMGQGPTSRATLPGATMQRTMVNAYGEEEVVTQTEEIPVPDMFRTEAPLVERNVRFDYMFTNDLQDPPADESQFFTEISYAFSEKFGVIFAVPYLDRDHFTPPDGAGFGDVAAGARYVALGSEQTEPFKLAFGFNVSIPTGDEGQELGAGQAVLEPEVLTQFILSEQSFAQLQLSLGIPAESGETTEFEYNAGFGYVFRNFPNSELFSYPTAIAELNGLSGIGGPEAGLTIFDITAGLRWSVGEKFFAGVAASVPVTEDREFETQLIFSLMYRYGVEPGVDVPSGIGSPSSRAYF